MADTVKLLSFWASAFGLRVQIALELKGIEYEYKEENLPSKSEELLQVNPVYKKVPVLIHNGRTVCESSIILEYIDDVWPQHKLLPQDPYDKALARFWADLGDKKIFDYGTRIMLKSGEAQAKAAEELKEALKPLDKALNEISPGKPFFGGDEMNFADVGLAPSIYWFHAFETLGIFKFPGPEECPYLHKWIEAVKNQDAVKKVMPKQEKITEFVILIQGLRHTTIDMDNLQTVVLALSTK